jgi:protocatechuate 3,4-dioxygenase beta subunit
MLAKPLLTGTILALAMALLLVGFYPHTSETEPAPESPEQVAEAAIFTQQSSHRLTTTNADGDRTDNQTRPQAGAITADTSGYTGKIEVYGRVIDENNQPLAGVLVADEINLGNSRSKSDGSYRISIEQDPLKTPVLIFLRNGYRENRIGIAIHNSPRQSSYEINVTLKSSADSTNVHGWVGNGLGEGLGGRKISIRAQAGQEIGIKFYTVITASNGEFLFEGVHAGVTYKLTIEPSEQYAGYTREPLRVSPQTPRLTIMLDRLNLVDVEGLIVGVDNGPVANFGFNVQNLSLDYPDRRITSDSSGFFALRGFPAGELKLSTIAPEYFKITDLSLDTGNYQNLRLVIDKGSHLLSGWISDENGVPLEKARITLDAKFSDKDYQSHSHRSIVTDSSGYYQFSQLGGVDHRVSVYASGYATYEVNHRFSSFSDQLDIRLSK